MRHDPTPARLMKQPLFTRRRFQFAGALLIGALQVNQGHVAEVAEVNHKLQYDFFYIKYFSPWLDLLILFRTVKTVLTGFGSR